MRGTVKESPLGASRLRTSISSRHLAQVHTFPSGKCKRCIKTNPILLFLGTFARVWLTRLKDSKDAHGKVFALKVLRKADGMENLGYVLFFFSWANCLWTVIKLKQVEHVRNERRVLAAVAGHPFITTLTTSFSDDQCLYMLVRVSLAFSVKAHGFFQRHGSSAPNSISLQRANLFCS
jgi:serine/threonine protein kinase